MFGKRKKHQVRIQHQSPSSSKRRLFIILFLFIAGGVYILNQNKNAETKPKAEDPKESQQQDVLMNKDIQKQIQQDYKSNLLKRQMIADEFRYKKHKYIPEKPPENSREDYTLKDGVHLSQDESFNDLLSALQTTEDAEAEEDIEEHIARYHIIEEKIQKNFQETTQETPQDTTPEDTDPKKTYAQEFIENARRGGYEVKLDANLKVKSVKKIK